MVTVATIGGARVSQYYGNTKLGQREVMIITAWSSLGPIGVFFDADSLKNVMTIFITYAFLIFLQATLDIILLWNSFRNMTFSQSVRYFLKFVVAAVWVVVLPICYFMIFFLPPLRKALEQSNMRIITFFMWWAQIQTLEMLHSRFQSIPLAFSQRFWTGEDRKTKQVELRVRSRSGCNPSFPAKNRRSPSHRRRRSPPAAAAASHQRPDETYERNKISYFSQFWNEFINSMREEDRISDRDRDLLLIPYSSTDVSVIQWPLFLLANKIPTAVQMAKDYEETDDDLSRKIRSDEYMCSAVVECYESLKDIILNFLLDEIDRLFLQTPHQVHVKRGERFVNINTSLTHKMTKVNRLLLLLSVKESAINVPQNLEAQRRIKFFANSLLFTNMPKAPKVRDMLSFSVLTPYFKEDILYTDEELNKENEDGISVLSYLIKIYPDEWINFHERLKGDYLEKDVNASIRRWASYRGQTLYRTVKGMMYYWEALILQCFIEFAGDTALSEGFRTEDFYSKNKEFLEKAQAIADSKFTYVLSCPRYGDLKKSKNESDRSRYISILSLMLTHSPLRVAYIDEREETVNGKSQNIYYSVLVKGREKYDEVYTFHFHSHIPHCFLANSFFPSNPSFHRFSFKPILAHANIDHALIADLLSKPTTNFVYVKALLDLDRVSITHDTVLAIL
ncbi:hypothetical protein Fmac_026892 [Flemingia macrophylla]|uniref:Uncharacterized protein n=1 Tax=Flemingia macrophylla TaxID=520843 RepID=A0ABD1LG41_9FABA